MKLSDLSPRRKQIVELLAQRKSNKEIAEALSISPNTVGVHISNICVELGVSGRGGILDYFFELTPRN